MILLVHDIEEVAIASVVYNWWMFFTERFFKTPKRFVSQKARHEGRWERYTLFKNLVYT